MTEAKLKQKRFKQQWNVKLTKITIGNPSELKLFKSDIFFYEDKIFTSILKKERKERNLEK